MKCIERSYSKKWDLDCGHPFPRVSDIREGVRLRRFVLQSVECTINSVGRHGGNGGDTLMCYNKHKLWCNLSGTLKFIQP